LTHELNSLNTELDALHEAFHQSEKILEKVNTELENVKRELDEYKAQHTIEERRAAAWKYKFHALKEQVENALRIED
jgi:chromosome segregation ATPase